MGNEASGSALDAASAIVQRMKGDLDDLLTVSASVKAVLASGDMAVIRDESASNPDKTLPVLYCSEIIDTPLVRDAITKAVSRMDQASGD